MDISYSIYYSSVSNAESSSQVPVCKLPVFGIPFTSCHPGLDTAPRGKEGEHLSIGGNSAPIICRYVSSFVPCRFYTEDRSTISPRIHTISWLSERELYSLFHNTLFGSCYGCRRSFPLFRGIFGFSCNMLESFQDKQALSYEEAHLGYLLLLFAATVVGGVGLYYCWVQTTWRFSLLTMVTCDLLT